MSDRIQQKLNSLLQAITINANCPYNLDDFNILLQYEFYFTICQSIFPELNIKLIKIKQNEQLEPGQKMQKLLDLLTQELKINLSSIKGAQILKGDYLEMIKFLQFLEEFSKHYQNSQQNSSGRRVRSDPNTSEREPEQKDRQNVPRSARQKIRQVEEEEFSEEERDKIPKRAGKRSKGPSQYSVGKKQKRSRTQMQKNLYGSMVDIMMKQKNKAMMANLRSNRKPKNQEIIQAKNKYKAYLLSYAKQNKASKNKDSLIYNKTHPKRKMSQRELPVEDFQNINCLFKSFQYKLRDSKYAYLKRVEKIIKTQEIDRMCYLNKLQQDRSQILKKSTRCQLQRIQNEHRIRTSMLKQELQDEKQSNRIIKKQYEKYLRSEKKQLKQSKKKQLRKIKQFMEQQNQKVLINLQEGGRLERVILDMYKRF